jgi:hypothetical protein
MKNGWLIAEVSRLATDGCPNACSILYAAAARAAKAMGYMRIITYIFETEPGTSLRGAGWTQDPGTYGGQTWANRPGRKDVNTVPKGRWSLELNPSVDVNWPDENQIDNGQLSLAGGVERNDSENLSLSVGAMPTPRSNDR